MSCSGRRFRQFLSSPADLTGARSRQCMAINGLNVVRLASPIFGKGVDCHTRPICLPIRILLVYSLPDLLRLRITVRDLEDIYIYTTQQPLFTHPRGLSMHFVNAPSIALQLKTHHGSHSTRITTSCHNLPERFEKCEDACFSKNYRLCFPTAVHKFFSSYKRFSYSDLTSEINFSHT